MKNAKSKYNKTEIDELRVAEDSIPLQKNKFELSEGCQQSY